MKPQKPVASYQERSVQKFKQALKAEFTLIKSKHKELKSRMEDMHDSTIDSANLCREIGLHLQTACNHEHINLEFWTNNDCERQLGFGYDAANGFISLARRMPDKVTKIEQAAPFIQLIFQTVGMLELPERIKQQNRISVGVVQKFFGEIAIVRKDFSKAVRQLPMENWSNMLLDSFMKDTQWLADERSKAEKLMEGK